VIAYLARRIGQAVAVVAGVLILTFVMIHLEPGSAARATLGMRATPGRIAIFNSTYGLNEPLYQQFVSYVDQIAHGNLGTSYSLQQPVSTLIVQRVPRDAVLLGLAVILAVAIAVPMGIYQAVHRDQLTDHLATGMSFTLYSMPDFFFAILLISLFSVEWHILPPAAPQATSVAGILADPRALILPVVTLTLVILASFSRYMRSSAIDVLAQDYIQVARAKGLPQRLILMRHVLRNAILPVVTMIGLSFSWIITGAVIAEAVFNYPGMGLLFYQAATSHDFPVMLGSALVIGIVTVTGNLIADIAYGILDPRIRRGGA
jgi:peptide/nickel transport system permease protein